MNGLQRVTVGSWKFQSTVSQSQSLDNNLIIFLFVPLCCRFTQNYGVLGVLDRLHGTDVMFRNSKAYDRHIMLLGLTPLKQTFPDNTKKGAPCKSE